MSDKDSEGFCFQNRKLLRRLNIKDSIKDNYEVTQYISSQPSLINQLIHIIWDSEEVDFSNCAINMLYSLLVLSNDEEKQVIMKTVNTSEHLNILTHCTYNIHVKFCELKEYRDSFPNMQTKLLHMISTIYQVKKCRKLTIPVTESTVRFYGILITSQTSHKDLMLHLLPVLKILCLNKRNNEILSSHSFFDSLYLSCKLTQKVSTVVFILKLMSRSAIALQCIANNQKIIELVINLVKYNGKRIVNKRSLMTILYRITATSSGLNLFVEADGFNTLFNFFTNSDSNRLAAIKAYTILYRTVPSLQLPQTQTRQSNYHGYEDDDESSGESDLESDASEDENEDEDVDEGTYFLKNISDDRELDDMSAFFPELIDANQNRKLDIFETASEDPSLSRHEIIAHRVFNAKHLNKQAYPDTLHLNVCNEEHYLNSTTNELPLEHLRCKLMNAKGLSENKYKSRIVYDVDQHIPDLEQSLRFDSRFECGNLRCVKQIGNLEYELILDSDTNSCNGHQWFYFQISNTTAETVYTFNIINFLKINSQYNYGMQPLMFSVKDYAMQGNGWRRSGENIVYYGNNYTDIGCAKQYRTLSFCTTFKYSNDIIYLAYHYPYTYTRLLTLISSLTNYDNSNGIFLKVAKLCNTASCKNELPLLTITASSPVNRRPLIFITSRVHPGETNSSWIVEGIINFLLNKENEQARRARELFIFKIIPMLNPDGVIMGNTRSGLNGNDLNRCWLKPHRYKCPEIYFTKKLLEYAKNVLRQPISLYLDIHGHSRKKFFFFYGCNPTMSWNKSDAEYGDAQDILKVFPQMIHGFTPHVHMNYCKYKIQKAKESTGRVVVWREFGIPYSYTLECSYCAGAEQQAMDTKILSDIGASIVNALASFADKSIGNTKFMSTLGVDESCLHSFVITSGEKRENCA
ncbi:hypothetical protein RI129_011595 [Pyrocoelia pectoralis]|uniref:Peptidase M14 domain-containing protein n=1 Tax=Pyrocoelia pectoralis TaxID=417401 RepID=A0AAN7V1V7_9COLE